MEDEYWKQPNNGPQNSWQPDRPDPVPQKPPVDQMAIASLVCGIASIVMVCCGGSTVLGAMGIIFALLSRKKKMEPQAKAGLLLSASGLVLYGIMLAMMLSMLYSTGTLAKIYSQSEKIDLGDPASVQEFVYEFQDDITQMYQNLLKELPGGSVLSEDSGGTQASIDRDTESLQQDVAYDPVSDYDGQRQIQPEITVAHADGNFLPAGVFNGVTDQVPADDGCCIVHNRVIEKGADRMHGNEGICRMQPSAAGAVETGRR